MKSAFVIFCIQICLIQHVFSQRVNGQAIVNNGLPCGSNGLGGQLPGPTLGRMTPEFMSGPGIGPMGPNSLYGKQGPAYASGMPNSAYGAGMPSQGYGPGMPYATYGGSGNGDVAVLGELPVAGMTAVTGQVPLTGKVAFNGNVPCGGIVTITGTCTCGCNAPYGQLSGYGNKPYGY